MKEREMRDDLIALAKHQALRIRTVHTSWPTRFIYRAICIVIVHEDFYLFHKCTSYSANKRVVLLEMAL